MHLYKSPSPFKSGILYWFLELKTRITQILYCCQIWRSKDPPIGNLVIGGYNPNRDTIMYSNANQHDIESTVFMFLCIFFLVEDTTLSESRMQTSILIIAFSLVGSTVGAVRRYRYVAGRWRVLFGQWEMTTLRSVREWATGGIPNLNPLPDHYFFTTSQVTTEKFLPKRLPRSVPGRVRYFCWC